MDKGTKGVLLQHYIYWVRVVTSLTDIKEGLVIQLSFLSVYQYVLVSSKKWMFRFKELNRWGDSCASYCNIFLRQQVTKWCLLYLTFMRAHHRESYPLWFWQFLGRLCVKHYLFVALTMTLVSLIVDFFLFSSFSAAVWQKGNWINLFRIQRFDNT